jgi:hypothetical protein
MDIQGDLISFGGLYSSPSIPGLTVTYGESGSSSILSFAAGQPTSTWLWQNTPSSGTNPVTAMELDCSNRLTLTGTGSSPGNILIDPNAGQVTINGNGVLTQAGAGTLYLTPSEGDDRYYVQGTTTIAFGADATASGYGAVAVGPYTTATNGATAIGSLAYAQGAFALAIENSTANGNDCAAFADSSASGYAAISIGLSYASGTGCAAIGEAGCSGVASSAFGNAEAWNSYAVATGRAEANGVYSAAFGAAYADGEFSTAFGPYGVAQAYGSVVFGQYNIPQGSGTNWVATDDLFVIGNGSSNQNPSNALEIQKNGNAILSGTLSISGSNPVLIQPSGDLTMGSFTNGPSPN